LVHKKSDPHQRLAELERWSANATLLIFFGILIEIVLLLYFPHDPTEKIGTVVANALIGAGLIVEYVVILRAIVASGAAQRASDEKVALAEARAAEANRSAEEEKHARLKLEAHLAPRSLTEEQFNILQRLRGKIAAVNVAMEVGLEPTWLGMQIVTALSKMDIKVGVFSRGPNANSSGNMLFDALAFANPHGEPTGGEPLASVLKEAGLWDGGLMSVMPLDISGPLDVPMFMVGGRFPLPPKPPYLGPADQMPPSAMDR
jgi:hypothetical protein